MKNVIKITAAIILLLSLQTAGFSQNDTSFKKTFKHNIGFGAGFTTGYGLAYRYMPERFGIQGVIGGKKDSYESEFNAGVTFIYDLNDTRFTTFYIYQSNSYKYNFTKNDGYYSTGSSETNTINNGLGFGLELRVSKHLCANAMVGYGSLESGKEIQPVGEVCFFYKL